MNKQPTRAYWKRLIKGVDQGKDRSKSKRKKRPSKKSRRAHLQNAIIRLAEYEDAEEQGLLLRLPCKVGDTVYEIDGEGAIIERHIYDVEYRQTRYGTEVSFATATLWFPWKSIGETVFFTREEAEAKGTVK